MTWRDTTHFDSEDYYRTGCQNVTHCQQQQSYSGLRSLGRSNSTYIYSFISLLLFNKNNTWRPTCFIIQTTGFNRPAKFLVLLKHWGYDNFELNWFHGLSKSLAFPFSQVSADAFRFNIQKCSRSLYAFIAFRPTCFARHSVMRNLHETSTQRAR